MSCGSPAQPLGLQSDERRSHLGEGNPLAGELRLQAIEGSPRQALVPRRVATHAVVLCAGFGTRLAPLTDHVPKPLIPLVNRPMLDRVLTTLEAAGITQVGINLHHHADQLQAFLDQRTAPPQTYTVYEPELLDTGGGVANFRSWLEAEAGDAFLVHNADIVHNLDLAGLVQAHIASGAEVTLALVDHAPTNVVSIDAAGGVLGIRNPVPGEAQRLTFAGIAVYARRFLARLQPGHRSSIIDAMRASMGEDPGQVRGVVMPPGAYWRDMGNLADYLEVHRECVGSHPALVPAGSIRQGSGLLEPTAVVHPSAHLEGFVVVGAEACIEADVVLEDCVVGPGVRVPSGTVARRAVFLNDCVAYAS